MCRTLRFLLVLRGTCASSAGTILITSLCMGPLHLRVRILPSTVARVTLCYLRYGGCLAGPSSILKAAPPNTPDPPIPAPWPHPRDPPLPFPSTSSRALRMFLPPPSPHLPSPQTLHGFFCVHGTATKQRQNSGSKTFLPFAWVAAL